MVKKLWNKNYLLLLQGSAVSTLGDLMYSVAIGYWVYEKTGSSALMGIMSSISLFVTMFLSPFSGSIIDKCNRKWVLVLGDFFQSAIMLTVGVFAYLNRLSVAGILIAAFLASLGGVFYAPAANTALVDIIPRDDMVRGQSLFSGVNSTINMVGTAVSGVVVAFFGVPLIIVLNGLSNAYAAISELFIKVPKSSQEGDVVTVKGVLNDMKSAVKEITEHPQLKIFIPFLIIINLFSAGAFTLILPFVLEKGFAVEQYGYLMTVWTVASLAAALVLGVFKLKPKARYWSMALSFCMSGFFLAFTYLSENFILTCVMAFFAGVTNTIGNTIFNAAFMLALPEKNRGVIMGFVSSASVGGTALSALIYGVLGEIFPLYIVFTVGNMLSLIPMIYFVSNKQTKEFILNN